MNIEVKFPWVVVMHLGFMVFATCNLVAYRTDPVFFPGYLYYLNLFALAGSSLMMGWYSMKYRALLAAKETFEELSKNE